MNKGHTNKLTKKNDRNQTIRQWYVVEVIMQAFVVVM